MAGAWHWAWLIAGIALAIAEIVAPGVFLIWIGAAGAVLMTIGLWTRLVTATVFVVVAVNVLLSTTHFRHNRTFLMIVLAAIAIMPSGRVLSVDAWRRRRAGHHAPAASKDFRASGLLTGCRHAKSRHTYAAAPSPAVIAPMKSRC